MIVLGLLLALAAPGRAQLAPAPSEPVTAANLDEVFRKFASGRPMLPTLKEVQAAQLERDLAPRPGDASPADAPPPEDFAGRGAPAKPGERRTTLESVDVALSRPLRRVELGAGYAERDVEVGNLHLQNGTSRYAFLRVDLTKAPLARKLFHSPTAVHARAELGEKTRVESDEYTTKFLTNPR